MVIKKINKNYRNYVKDNCIICNKEFEHREDYKTKCCSPECSSKWTYIKYPNRREQLSKAHIGYKATEETKLNMSKAKIKEFSNYTKEFKLNRIRKAIDANRLPYGECAFNKLYRDYQTHSKNRKLIFNIDKDTFRKIVTNKCKYCGIEPSTRKDYGNKQVINGAFYYNGIDRIDSNLGYINGNVIPCCKVCNYAKRNMSVFEFTQWLKRINNNLFNNNKIIEIELLGSNEELTK